MASLMDEYPMPGMDVDPRELERMKYLALIRMGAGMMGKEKPGSAVQGGINTYIAGEESARRNADQKMQEMRAKMQYAMGMKKAQQEAEKQAKVESLVKGIASNKAARDRYGITDEMMAYVKATGDMAPIVKTMEAYTSKEGDVRMIGNEPFATRSNKGRVPVFSGGVEVGQVPQEGYAEEDARRAGLEQAAKTRNTFQNLGTGPKNEPLGFGYPPQPPSLVPGPQPTTNFSGSSADITAATQAMDADRARQSQYPNRGRSPVEENLLKEFGTKSVTDWFTVGKDSQESAALAAHIRSKVGVMRDVLAQPGRPEGLFGPFMVAAQQAGASIGIPTEGLPASELFNSLTTQIALTVRNPAGDMGLPGAASNQDFTRLIAVSPNLSQSARGQKLLVESFDAMSDMAIKKAELWADLNVRIEGGEITPAKARQEYTKAITPYAMEATKTIKAAIKESEALSKSGAIPTGATAAPSTQRAVELNKLNQREKEIEERLRRARGQ